MRVPFTLILLVLLNAFHAGAAPLLGTETPEHFFDKVAGTLLEEELGLDLHHISIYPTNHYSPEVHRLLQMTANLYDSTTNRGDAYPWFPTCFRPRFSTKENEVFISGYVEETGVSFSDRPWHVVEDPNDRPIGPDDNIYNFPIIIGAKRGFPNFNEFVLQSVVQFTRKLELRKTVPWTGPTETNQMLIIGVSNTVAFEVWNPWASNYPRPLTMKVGIRTTCALTNENGFRLTNTAVHGFLTNIPAGEFTNSQFRIPLLITDVVLTNSIFRSTPYEHFDPIGPTNLFERGVGFPTNLWGLETKARAIVLMSDGEHLIDFVALSNLKTAMDVSKLLTQETGIPSFWNVTPAAAANIGILNQISVSLGNFDIGDWRYYDLNPPSERYKAIELFRGFFYGGTNTNLVMQAPFTPTQKMLQSTTWEANDPFLHQTTHQLTPRLFNPTTARAVTLLSPITIAINSTIGRLNRSYAPWEYNLDFDPFAYDFAIKDPGVYSSDYWPADLSSPLSLATIGRVHRGTPWQSIYLKSAVAPLDDWFLWYGSLSGHPTNDWQLASILASMLNTNLPQRLLSINSTNRAEWAPAFDGLIVSTNDEECSLSNFVIHATSPEVSTILDGISRTRLNSSLGYFDHLGAVLATPELTAASPWFAFLPYLFDCLPDAAFEALPSQLLPRLRPDPVANIFTSDETFGIQFRVIPGQTYEVQTSEDLQTWRSVSTNVVLESSFTFSDSPNLNHRFYRLKLVQ